jgi:hypothetical protein
MTNEKLQIFYDSNHDFYVILRRYDMEREITLHDFVALTRNVILKDEE